MVAQGGTKGDPSWNLGRGVYSPVGLLFPQRGAWRRRVAPRGVLVGTWGAGCTPRWDSFSRSWAHGGAGWRQGGSLLESEAQDVLPGGTPFPAVGRMVAQGGDKGVPSWNLRRRMYSPVALLFPQLGAW